MMHDTTCGPALVDLAAARSAIAEAGGDPATINPVLPVDVSTDHSLAIDVFGPSSSARINMAREMARNAERYRFMKWASSVLTGFTVHPPAPASCTRSTSSGWRAWSRALRGTNSGRCPTR
jgi:aconitate hydratase